MPRKQESPHPGQGAGSAGQPIRRVCGATIDSRYQPTRRTARGNACVTTGAVPWTTPLTGTMRPLMPPVGEALWMKKPTKLVM